MLECAVPAAYQLDHVYRLNKSLYVMARTFPVVRTRERWKTRVKKNRPNIHAFIKNTPTSMYILLEIVYNFLNLRHPLVISS
jgi:hypothetical protein